MQTASQAESISLKSQTLNVDSDRMRVLTGSYSVIDSIFPLFDEMSVRTSIPGFLLSLTSIYLLLQFAVVPYWIYSECYGKSTKNTQIIYGWLFKVFTWIDPWDLQGSMLPYILLDIVVLAISVIWFIAMIFYYKIMHGYSTLLLYISTIVLDIIVPLFIIPSSMLCANSIVRTLYNITTEGILGIVIGGVAYVGYISVLCISINLKSRSVVLTNLMFPLFDAQPIVIYTVLNSSLLIVNAIMIYFNSWMLAIIQLLHLLCTLFLTYKHVFLPFYDIWRNSVSVAIAIYTIVINVLTAICLLTNGIIPYVYVSTCGLATLIIVFISSFFGFKQTVRKISRQLTHDDETERNKVEYFQDLGLDTRSEKAIMYLVVGFCRNCDYFVDGSLTDFMVNNTTTHRELSIVLQAVTFFPSESRKLNLILSRLAQKKAISFADRFLLYQVYRIKTRRLVSDTKDTFELLKELQNYNRQCKVNVRSFWTGHIQSATSLTSVSQNIRDVQRRFEQAVANNPNNPRIAVEYSNFLSECLCDFDNAILQHVIAERIGDGHNFNVDVSFRSLVQKFPNYLKKGILDPKGRRIIKVNQGASDSRNQSVSSNSSNSMSKGSTMSSMSIDAEHQETVGKVILKQSKLRLAFHHAIYDRKPTAATTFIYAGFFTFSVVFIGYVVLNIFMSTDFISRADAIENLKKMTSLRFYTDIAIFVIYTTWANTTGRIGDIDKILGYHDPTMSIVRYELPPEQTIIYAVNTSREAIDVLLDRVSSLSQEGYPVYKLTGSLLSADVQVQTCVSGKPHLSILTSLKDKVSYMDYLGCALAPQSIQEDVDLYATNDYCEILANAFSLAEGFSTTFKALQHFQVGQYRELDKKLKLYLYIATVLLILLSCVPPAFIIGHYIFGTRQTMKMLLNLNANVKENAQLPLRCDTSEDSENTSGKLPHIEPTYSFWSSVAIYYVGVASVTALFIYTNIRIINLNTEIANLNAWYYYSSLRACSCAEAGNDVLQLILLANGVSEIQQKIVTQDDLIIRANEDSDEFMNSHNYLIRGSSLAPSSLGYSEELDNLHLKETCNKFPKPKNLHQSYACASLSHQATLFNSISQNIANQPDIYRGEFMTEDSVNTFHILPYHLWPNVAKADWIIADLVPKVYEQVKNEVIIYTVIGIIIAALEVIFACYVRYEIINNYKMLMVLFEHLSPQDIAYTKEVIGYFMNKQSSSSEAMSVSKSIVYNSSEGICITGANMIIEQINPALTQSIGFTPDQVLGQSIANFMKEDQATLISEHMTMMINHQGSLIYEDHITLQSDDASQIPFHVTIIGMHDENSTDITSFVFILNNETESIRKHKEAEEAKAKSEKLLYQILPKDVVFRLNRGEKDISFTIPHATIFFIDIVKFSDYAAMLTPSEIMANLSMIFDAFDANVAQYETITKIKLIGDVYMAASGLFSPPDGEPSVHAEEAIKCCLGCLKSLEEINVKLDSQLEVRIGVNTDGPIIAGVLGTEKPTFDIIGDPINVASRLQSTDLPGRVQVSKATKEVIQNCDFIIEERGEIYLKGKGKQMTYLVSQFVLPVASAQSSFVHSLAQPSGQIP